MGEPICGHTSSDPWNRPRLSGSLRHSRPSALGRCFCCVCARTDRKQDSSVEGGEVKRAVLEPGPEIPAAPTFLSRAASLPEPAGGSTTLRLCPSAFPVARLYIRLSQGNRGTARQSESVNQNRRPVRRPRPSRLVRSQPDHAPGVDWGGRCGSLRPRSGAGEEVRR